MRKLSQNQIQEKKSLKILIKCVFRSYSNMRKK